MSKVNLLPLDTMPTPEVKGKSGDYTSSSKTEGNSFSDVIDRHYNSKQSGNKAEKTDSVKEKTASNASNSNDDKQVKSTGNRHEANNVSADGNKKENNEHGNESVRNAIADDNLTSPEEKELTAVDDLGIEENDDTHQFLSLLSAANQILFTDENASIDSDKTAIDSNKVAISSDKIAISSDKAVIGSDKAAIDSDKVAIDSDKTAIDSDKIAIDSDKIAIDSDKIAIHSDKISADGNETGTLEKNAKVSAEIATLLVRTEAEKLAEAESLQAQSTSKDSSQVNKNIAKDLLIVSNKEQKTFIIKDEQSDSKQNEEPEKIILDKKLPEQKVGDNLLKAQTPQENETITEEAHTNTEKVKSSPTIQDSAVTVKQEDKVVVSKVLRNETIVQTEHALSDEQVLAGKTVDQDVALDESQQPIIKGEVTKVESDKSTTKKENALVTETTEKPVELSNDEAPSIATHPLSNTQQSNNDKLVETNDVLQGQKRAVNQATASVVSQSTEMNNNPNKGHSSPGNDQSTDTDNSNYELENIAGDNANDEQLPISDKKIKTNNLFMNNANQLSDSRFTGINSLQESSEQIVDSLINKISSDSLLVNGNKPLTAQQVETIAIHRKDFSDAIKDKVMVMINQKLQQVEIRLDPAELGQMQVRVNLQNEQAVVSFMVQNQQAKEALDQNMGKLREMLAESGVDVGDANIEQQKQQTASNEHSEQQKHSDQGGFSDEHSNENVDLSKVQLYKASSTGVDYYA